MVLSCHSTKPDATPVPRARQPHVQVYRFSFYSVLPSSESEHQGRAGRQPYSPDLASPPPSVHRHRSPVTFSLGEKPAAPAQSSGQVSRDTPIRVRKPRGGAISSASLFLAEGRLYPGKPFLLWHVIRAELLLASLFVVDQQGAIDAQFGGGGGVE
jgi:hypothetical protein